MPGVAATWCYLWGVRSRNALAVGWLVWSGLWECGHGLEAVILHKRHNEPWLAFWLWAVRVMVPSVGCLWPAKPCSGHSVLPRAFPPGQEAP